MGWCGVDDDGVQKLEKGLNLENPHRPYNKYSQFVGVQWGVAVTVCMSIASGPLGFLKKLNVKLLLAMILDPHQLGETACTS